MTLAWDYSGIYGEILEGIEQIRRIRLFGAAMLKPQL